MVIKDCKITIKEALYDQRFTIRNLKPRHGLNRSKMGNRESASLRDGQTYKKVRVNM